MGSKTRPAKDQYLSCGVLMLTGSERGFLNSRGLSWDTPVLEIPNEVSEGRLIFSHDHSFRFIFDLAVDS